MSTFDWCVGGRSCSGCPGTVVTFYVDDKNKVHETGTRSCGCPCHGGGDGQ